MKKLSIVFLLVLALTSFSQETTEKITRANIAVILPEIIGTDSRLAVLSLTIRDNIAFTLKLMGKYKVMTQDQPIDFEDRDAIKNHAIKNKLDSVIFGRIIKLEDDSIMIKMAIYDQYMDKITMDEEVSIKSIFEIFDASDILVVKLIEGFSGVHVAYGSLNLENKGDKGRYKVFIDNEYIGESLSSIPKVFYGEHNIHVEQDRLFGEKIMLLNETVLLKEDETLNLTFEIPQLTEKESREFYKLDIAIMENWDNYDGKTEAALQNAISLLEDPSPSKSLSDLKEKYTKFRNFYYQKPNNIKWISGGAYHTLIITDEGDLWATGFNENGQLGTGDIVSRTEFVPVLNNVIFAAGSKSNSFAVRSDNTLWATGDNTYGQLGTGDTTSYNTYIKVLDGVSKVACGYEHSLILKTDGTLWVTGGNDKGKLGLGPTTGTKEFVYLASDVKEIGCFYDHNMILKEDNSVWVCGGNEYGQLGTGDNNNRNTLVQVFSDAKDIACFYGRSAILKFDGTVWGAGKNDGGYLGTGDKNNRNKFVKVFDNAESMDFGSGIFIIKSDKTLWGTGKNGEGELGTGDSIASNKFIKISSNVVDLNCVGDHNFIVKENGEVWATGRNDRGQLGLGHTDNVFLYTRLDKFDLHQTTKSCTAFHKFFPQKSTLFATSDNINSNFNISSGSLSTVSALFKKSFDTETIAALTEYYVTTDPEIINNMAKPFLNTISGKTPDFEDDFDKNNGGWTLGHNKKVSNRVTPLFEDGYLKQKAGGTGSGSPWISFLGNFKALAYNFILEIDVIIPNDKNTAGITWGQIKSGSGCSIKIQNPNKTWMFDHLSNNSSLNFINANFDSDKSIDGAIRIKLIVKDYYIIAYINEEPVVFIYYPVKRKSDYICLVATNNANKVFEVTALFDNMKLWNLDLIEK